MPLPHLCAAAASAYLIRSLSGPDYRCCCCCCCCCCKVTTTAFVFRCSRLSVRGSGYRSIRRWGCKSLSSESVPTMLPLLMCLVELHRNDAERELKQDLKVPAWKKHDVSQGIAQHHRTPSSWKESLCHTVPDVARSFCRLCTARLGKHVIVRLGWSLAVSSEHLARSGRYEKTRDCFWHYDLTLICLLILSYTCCTYRSNRIKSFHH